MFIGFSILLNAAAQWSLGQLGNLLGPKAKPPDPGAVSEAKMPSVHEGEPIPVVFGCCRIDQPFIGFRSDVDQFWHSDRGFDYFASFVLALCMGPIDGVYRVLWDDANVNNDSEHPLVTTWDTDHWQLQIESPKFWGGPKSPDAPISGAWDVYPGTTGQGVSGRLSSRYGGTHGTPRWKRVCYAVMTAGDVLQPDKKTGFRYGQERSVRPLGFVVYRYPNPLGLPDGKHMVTPSGYDAGDVNPANVLYEVLTDSIWGPGIPSGYIDSTSFYNAGLTLYDEGLGISILYDRTQQYQEFVEEVLKHIDGVMRENPWTGLLELKLIRNDYLLGDLPILDESCVSRLEVLERTIEDTSNFVTTRYIERSARWKERSTTSPNPANIQARGGRVVKTEVTFRGASNLALAQKLGDRTLRQVSYPFPPIVLHCNRKAWYLRRGDVARLQWADPAIDMAVRILDVDTGDLTNSELTITCTEDQFALEHAIYPGALPEPGSSHEPPYASPVAVVIPTPSLVATADHYNFWCLIAKPQGKTIGYDIWLQNSADGGGYRLTGRSTLFSPCAEVYGTVGILDDSFEVQTLPDYQDRLTELAQESNAAESQAGTRCCIILDPDGVGGYNVHDAEIMAYDYLSYNAGTSRYTVHLLNGGLSRGAHDSAPHGHAAVSSYKPLVFFVALAGKARPPLAYDGSFYALADVTVGVKCPTFNLAGTQPLSEAFNSIVECAAADHSTMRAFRPWCPYGLAVQGLDYPSQVSPINGAIQVSWSHKDKTVPSDYSLGNQVASRNPNVTYHVQFINAESSVVLGDYDGITLTNKSYSGQMPLYMLVKIWAEETLYGQVVRSYQELHHTFMVV